MKKVLFVALLCIFLFLLFLSPALIIMFPNIAGPFNNTNVWLFTFFGILIGWMLFATIAPIVHLNQTYSRAIKFVKSKLHPDEKLLTNEKVYFSLITPEGHQSNNVERNLYRTDVKNLFWSGSNCAGVFITNQRLLLITKKPEQKEFETVLELEEKDVRRIKIHEESVATSEYSVSRIQEITHLLFYFLLFRTTVPTGGKPPIMGLNLDITTSEGKYILKLGAYKFLRLPNIDESVNDKLKASLKTLFEVKLEH